MTFEVFYDADGTRFGLLAGRLLLQYRDGRLTDAAIDAAVEVTERSAREADPPLGFLAVIEGSAERTTVEIQARQRVHSEGFLATVDAWIGVVTLGEGVQAMSQRATGEVLLMGHPRVKHFADVETGVVWMAAKIGGVSPIEIAGAVDVLRRGGA